jgi:hypothetical protein|tara:strand:- start:369 stop:746 length:378 start_codon:yes stop_codon:yes gene_type:complete
MALTPFERSGTAGSASSKRNGERTGIPARGYDNAVVRAEAVVGPSTADKVTVSTDKVTVTLDSQAYLTKKVEDVVVQNLPGGLPPGFGKLTKDELRKWASDNLDDMWFGSDSTKAQIKAKIKAAM